MLINHQKYPSLKANSGIDCEVINMITITYNRYSAGGCSLRMENHNDARRDCKDHKDPIRDQ